MVCAGQHCERADGFDCSGQCATGSASREVFILHGSRRLASVAGDGVGVVYNARNCAPGRYLRSELHGIGGWRQALPNPSTHDAPPRTKGSVMETTLAGAHAFEHLYAHSIPIIILARNSMVVI